MANVKSKNSLPRVLSLFVALIGCIITAVPFAFGVAVYPTVKYTFGSPFDETEEKDPKSSGG